MPHARPARISHSLSSGSVSTGTRTGRDSSSRFRQCFAPPMRCAKFPAGRCSGRAPGRNRSREAGWSWGGTIGGKPTVLGIVNSGQYGFDLKDTVSPAATITHRPADRGVMSDYPAF